jgi:hypothetical protein
MKIYVICSVRNGTPPEVKAYVEKMRAEGHTVYFPTEDAPQDDPTGCLICFTHLAHMKEADRIDAFWDVTSFGSHFDLGMTYALGKPVLIVKLYQPDTDGKSYVKVMESMQ